MTNTNNNSSSSLHSAPSEVQVSSSSKVSNKSENKNEDNNERKRTFSPLDQRHKSINTLIAGTSSGAIASFLLYPLDSVKVRLQANERGKKKINFVGLKEAFGITKQMYLTEGWKSFYKGLTSATIGAGLSWGLYFALYNQKKYQYEDKYGVNKVPSTQLIICGLYAGLITNIITHPIWLIKTRLQLQENNIKTITTQQQHQLQQVKYKGTLDTLFKIIKYEGIKSLYIGIIPSTLLISHGIIHFVSYDTLKSIYLNKKNKNLYNINNNNQGENNNEPTVVYHLNGVESFTLGFVSKFFAGFSTYPLQVVKTRLQDIRNYYDGVRYKGFYDCCKKMYLSEGYKTFFRGIVPHVLKVSPYGALVFTLNEQIMKLLFIAERDRII